MIRGEGGIRALFRVENENGGFLAEGTRSMEGLAALTEMVMTDASGQFLLAFRLARAPGRPLIQVGIPYLAVDIQGQTIGELRHRAVGLAGRSYELWNQGEALMTVPHSTRSEPYPLLLRGTPVATIEEEKPRFGRQVQGTWTVRFSAPCPHLPALVLATYVAVNRGGGGVPA
ncbi:MAG TPA: hypothetical protein VEG42_00055 [Thermoplasmata archaeon]|nr:hypothetical protein [Thermoplasmata archaeon]